MILDECILIGDSDTEGLTRCIAAKIALFKLHDPHRAITYLDNENAKQVVYFQIEFKKKINFQN